MRKFFTFLCAAACVALAFPAFAQFQNLYDYGSDDFANMSVFSPDNGIVTVGSTNHAGGGGNDVFLQKIDASGNFVWMQQYGGSQTEFGTSVANASNGYIIAGRSNSYANGGRQDILLIKTDLNGVLQWSKTYGSDSLEVAINVATCSDNGFIVTGESQIVGSNRRETFLMKTDSNGVVEWYKTYGFQFGNESAHQVLQTQGGGFVMVGYSGAGGQGLNDAYVVITDATGNIIQQFLVGGTADDVGRRIVMDEANGKLYLCGTTRSNNQDDIFIARIDLINQSIDWVQKYGGNSGESMGDMVMVPGMGLGFGGLTQSFGGGQEGLMFIVDTANGNILADLMLTGTSTDIVMDVLIGAGITATGYTNSYGGTLDDAYIFQFTTPQGLCKTGDPTIPQSAVTMLVTGGINSSHVATTYTITGVSQTLTTGSSTPTTTAVCSIIDPLAANAGNDYTLCGPGSRTLGGSPTATGGLGYYRYQWSPSTGLDNDTIANPVATVSSTQLYSVTVTDSTGATATDDINVIVQTPPSVTVSADTTICNGTNATLSATGADNFSWSPSNSLSSNVGANVNAFPTSQTTYTVIGNTAGCLDTAFVTVNVNTVNLTVTPDTFLCDGSSIMLMATGAGSYTWSPGAGLSDSTIANPVASPSSFTTYTVIGTLGGCSASASVNVNVNNCGGNSPEFQRAYDLGNNDFTNMSVYSNDNKIVSVGSTNHSGAGNFDAQLMQFDSAGNFIWQKQYGGAQVEFGTAIANATDGYIIAGRSNSFAAGGQQDICLIKTDLAGDLQWAKTYGSDSMEVATYVSQAYDGGYIVTGETRVGGSNRRDAFLLKVDATGAVQWYKTYGHAFGNEAGNFVADFNGEGFLMVGYSGADGAGLNDAYVVKTDTLGNVEAQFLVGGTGDDVARRVLFSNDALFLVGTSRVQNQPDDVFVARVNTNNFTLDWFKTYGGASNESFSDAMEMPNAGFALVGMTQSFNSSDEGFLFLIDDQGVSPAGILFEGASSEIIQDIHLGNNGILLTGFSSSFGGTAENPYLLQFTDPQGLCNTQFTSFADSTRTAVMTTALPNHAATTVALTANTAAVTQHTTTATEVQVCAVAVPLSANAGLDVTICGAANRTLGGNPTASGGTGPYTYQWSPATGLSSATAANPTVNVTANATYTVVVTDSTGATATDAITINVNAKPNISVASDTTICSGESVVLVATGADNYAWTPATGLNAVNVANPTASPTNTTTYTVVGNTAGCLDTTTVTVTVANPCPGINDLSNNRIQLYPNPANSFVQLIVDATSGFDASLSIIGMDGKVAYRSDINTVKGSNTFTIQTRDLAAGVYLVQLKSAGTYLVKQLVIQK